MDSEVHDDDSVKLYYILTSVVVVIEVCIRSDRMGTEQKDKEGWDRKDRARLYAIPK